MTKSHIGKSAYYAVTGPATNDAAGFEALTWIKIPGYQGGFQFGLSHANIDVEDIEQGDTKTVRGMASYPDSTGTFRNRDETALRAAQVAFLEVVETPGSPTHSLKIVRATGADLPDGGKTPVAGDQVEYAQGYFHSPSDNEQTTTSHEGFSVTFKQNERQVKATEPAA